MLAIRWAKAAVVYFVIGVGVGLYMSLARMHVFGGLHAHVNLLGWVSMALMAGYCRAMPALETVKLARVQYWLYQVSFPLMMLGLLLSPMVRLMDNPEVAGIAQIVAMIGVGIGGLLVAVSVVLFAGVALTMLKREASENNGLMEGNAIANAR